VRHAIRSLSLATATTSLGNEPTAIGAASAERRLLQGSRPRTAYAVAHLPYQAPLSESVSLQALAQPRPRQTVLRHIAPRTTRSWLTARPTAQLMVRPAAAAEAATAVLMAPSRRTTTADSHRPSSPQCKWLHCSPFLAERS
jgi:hypothetical protein